MFGLRVFALLCRAKRAQASPLNSKTKVLTIFSHWRCLCRGCSLCWGGMCWFKELLNYLIPAGLKNEKSKKKENNPALIETMRASLSPS